MCEAVSVRRMRRYKHTKSKMREAKYKNECEDTSRRRRRSIEEEKEKREEKRVSEREREREDDINRISNLITQARSTTKLISYTVHLYQRSHIAQYAYIPGKIPQQPKLSVPRRGFPIRKRNARGRSDAFHCFIPSFISRLGIGLATSRAIPLADKGEAKQKR